MWINLPLYGGVTKLEIGLKADAELLPPPPLQTEPTARMHTAKAGVIFFRNAGHHTLSLESTRPELGSELQVAELILEHF